MSTHIRLEKNETNLFKRRDEVSSNQKTCTIAGIALSVIGVLAMVTLAITQTGLLQTVLSKYHILLTEKQIFAITMGIAIGGGATLLLGIPSLIFSSCRAYANTEQEKWNEPQSILPTTTYTAEEFQQCALTNQEFLSGPISVIGNLDLDNFYGVSLPKGLHVRDNLLLSGANKTLLPDGLHVGGDLILRGTRVTSLSDGLFVGGELGLYGCNSLTSLPEGLQVGGNLDLRSTSVTSLPNGLYVGGDFQLRGTRVTSLPDRLYVGGNLDLGNASLTSLPNGLYVGGNLDLENINLMSLPDKLHVGGNLSLHTQTNLRSLPAKLHVGGNFYLRGTRVTSLSDGLFVGGDLNLQETAVTSLPDGLFVGGDLNLMGCTHLTSLPSWITTLGPGPDGRIRTVSLENTGLSEAIIARLRATETPGMHFYFSHATSKPNHTFNTLAEAFTFWEVVPKPEIELEDNDLTDVLDFLGRLTTTAEYQNLQSRPGLKERLKEAFNLMATDEEMKNLSIALITNGLSSCDDRIISALDEIELAVRIRQVGDSEAELRRLGRGMLLLEMVDKKAQEHATTLTWVDEVEISLAFRTGLAERLDLPLSTRNMIFRRCAQITDEKLQAIGDVILKECTPKRIEAFLSTWDPWIRHQRKLSVSPYDTLPVAEAEGVKQECVITRCPTDWPVMYNEQVYDYKSFVEIYVNQGVDSFTRQPLQWKKLQRIAPIAK